MDYRHHRIQTNGTEDLSFPQSWICSTGRSLATQFRITQAFIRLLKCSKELSKRYPDDTQLILHSDQGWQYQMRPYQKMLKDKGIRQSMSRKGNCYDNSVMENFFGILKTEFFHKRKFSSIYQFSTELSEYIDYYNNRRIKGKLKGLSPIQFRSQSFFST